MREIGIGLGVVDLSKHDEIVEIVGAMEYARIGKCHLRTLFLIAVESCFHFSNDSRLKICMSTFIDGLLMSFGRLAYDGARRITHWGGYDR